MLTIPFCIFKVPLENHIPLFLMFKPLRYKLGYVGCVIVVILSQSASSYVALIAALLFYLVLSRRYKWFVAMFAASLGCSLYLFIKTPYFYSHSGRLRLWSHVLMLCREAPFSGQGLGHFAIRHFPH